MQNWIQPCVAIIKAAGKRPKPADFEAVRAHLCDAHAHRSHNPAFHTLGGWLIDSLCEPKYAKPFMRALHDYLRVAYPALAADVFPDALVAQLEADAITPRAAPLSVALRNRS